MRVLLFVIQWNDMDHVYFPIDSADHSSNAAFIQGSIGCSPRFVAIMCLNAGLLSR